MFSIEESISNFLANPELKVATLKGKWGVGKTFFWKNLLGQQKDLKFDSYSYVSLFGCKDIEGLKQLIISNFESLDENGIKKYLEKVKPFTEIIGQVEVPWIGKVSSFAKVFENKFLNNFLICFDDIERKEKTISTASFLGLVTNLAQECNCKILLIYNDQRLDKETEKSINEYREKVVDLEFSYNPTVENNLSIIWNDSCPEIASYPFYRLNLNNIRIMHKVKVALDYFKCSLEDFIYIKNSYNYKIACLTILYHGYSSILSIDEALESNYFTLGYDPKLELKEEESKEEIEKREILEALEYISDETDQFIVDYLKNGFIDCENFRKKMEIKNEENRLYNISDCHRKIWRKYHNNFSTTQDEFLTEHIDFIRNNYASLGLRDLYSSIRFIKELNKDIELDEILDKAIDLYVDKIVDPNRDEDRYFDVPEEVSKKISSKLEQRTDTSTIPELLEKLTNQEGWNPGEIKLLLKFNQDDFYDWFIKESDRDVIGLICVFLRRFFNDRQAQPVIERINAALSELKKRSPLDKCRIEYLIEKKRP